MRSRGVRGTQIRIGKRFTERIGYELHQAATYASKQDWSKAQDVYEEVTQMLDTFLDETGIGKYMEEQANARVDSPPAPVAAESEPLEEDTRAEEKDQAGSGNRPAPRSRKRATNKGPKRSGGSKGAGDVGGGNA